MWEGKDKGQTKKVSMTMRKDVHHVGGGAWFVGHGTFAISSAKFISYWGGLVRFSVPGGRLRAFEGGSKNLE